MAGIFQDGDGMGNGQAGRADGREVAMASSRQPVEPPVGVEYKEA